MRTIDFIRPCLKTMQEFPDEVKTVISHALTMASLGSKHQDAKPLVGFRGGSVLEIAIKYRGNAYRVVYALEFADAIYVVHAFQKKAHRGISTPQHEIDLVFARLKALRAVQRNKGKQK